MLSPLELNVTKDLQISIVIVNKIKAFLPYIFSRSKLPAFSAYNIHTQV